jgi:hypothetical protein
MPWTHAHRVRQGASRPQARHQLVRSGRHDAGQRSLKTETGRYPGPVGIRCRMVSQARIRLNVARRRDWEASRTERKCSAAVIPNGSPSDPATRLQRNSHDTDGYTHPTVIPDSQPVISFDRHELGPRRHRHVADGCRDPDWSTSPSGLANLCCERRPLPRSARTALLGSHKPSDWDCAGHWHT